MRYTFTSCGALAVLDLSGFDESALEDLFYCFSGSDALTTIYADADWALPAGCSGMRTFYNCKALVGGAGTAYASSRMAATYMRIDGSTTAPGYLTAKS